MNAVGLILGGGAGTRLQPLTRERSKPAVPLAGKYRLVDIPISNCINNGIFRIYLLTQFNSVSLHQHVQSTYQFDHFNERKFIRLLAAQQTPEDAGWYTGTADAVRKTMSHFLTEDAGLVVILSGDQLYRMDFKEMIKDHIARKAEVTIATKPVPREEAGSLGILETDADGQIRRFVEKPGNTPALDELRCPAYSEERYLASMGIYIFNKDVLVELLANDYGDFGKQVIPESIETHRVFSYIYEGYWKDIGTIGSFWEANLSLTAQTPDVEFYSAEQPIYTRSRFLPPSRVDGCQIERALISEGCIISGKTLKHSIAGIRSVIDEGAEVEDSILMGADFYDNGKDPVPLGVGKNCVIRRAIVDKNARIGEGCVLDPTGLPEDDEGPYHVVKDGIVVVPKNTTIPPHTRICGVGAMG